MDDSSKTTCSGAGREHLSAQSSLDADIELTIEYRIPSARASASHGNRVNGHCREDQPSNSLQISQHGKPQEQLHNRVSSKTQLWEVALLCCKSAARRSGFDGHDGDAASAKWDGLSFNLRREDVPEYMWMPFISSGYAYGPGVSLRTCAVQCLLRPSNQLINAWTIIAACLTSTGFFAYTWILNGFVLPFVLIWLSALIHNPFSVCFHLSRPLGAEISNVFRKLDIAFIFLASVLLAFALSYYVLPEPWQVGLLTGLAFFVAMNAIWRVLHLGPIDKLHKGHHAGVVGVICAIYWTPMLVQSIRDLHDGYLSAAVWSTLTVFVSLLLGATVYATCFPERYWPNKFDIVGSAHQIMHMAIIVAHAAEWVFLIDCHKRLEGLTS